MWLFGQGLLSEQLFHLPVEEQLAELNLLLLGLFVCLAYDFEMIGDSTWKQI